MTLFRNKYRVEPARLQTWDYSSPGLYFITICTSGRICLFGEIIGVEMKMNAYGKIVDEEWLKSIGIRRELKRDEFVVMPNHFHAIVKIVDSGFQNNHDGRLPNNGRDVAPNVSTEKPNQTINDPSDPSYNFFSIISPRPKSLSTIIRSFKSAVTNRIHTTGFKDDIWQYRFYDHIIRNERELFAIRQYIKNNPANWANDRNVLESEDNKSRVKTPWFAK